MNTKAATLLVTWFGAGKSPKAPGTVGSLAALPFAYAIQYYTNPVTLALAALVLFGVGVVACNAYVKAHPHKDDPQEIVIDEVAAQWLVLSALPMSLVGYAVGFAMFRLFDVLKPWPIRMADETIGGGFGIMFDDMLAAVYAIVVAWLVVGI